MNTPHRSGGHYQVPGGFENTSRAKLLPELNIELAFGRAALHEPRHSQAVGHVLIMTVACPPVHARVLHNGDE
jgi:hypothetical protein